MKAAPNENVPETRICLIVHIVMREGMLDAIFGIVSLPGNYNSCHCEDRSGRDILVCYEHDGPQEDRESPENR